MAVACAGMSGLVCRSGRRSRKAVAALLLVPGFAGITGCTSLFCPAAAMLTITEPVPVGVPQPLRLDEYLCGSALRTLQYFSSDLLCFFVSLLSDSWKRMKRLLVRRW